MTCDNPRFDALQLRLKSTNRRYTNNGGAFTALTPLLECYILILSILKFGLVAALYQ